MILVDSSIWIEHLRNGSPALERILLNSQVQIHPFILGELALGSLRARTAILDALGNLPSVILAKDPEVMQFIEIHKLHGSGIGYVDAHLLTSVALTAGTLLWTGDKRLQAAAAKLGIHWTRSTRAE